MSRFGYEIKDWLQDDQHWLEVKKKRRRKNEKQLKSKKN